MYRWTWLSAPLVLLPLLAGCTQAPPAAPPPKSPEVLVGASLTRQVTDYEVFTGRTEASERVDIRARVTGYLEKSSFVEGSLVKEGDLLFQIDPRPYAAELGRADAALTQAKARRDRLERDVTRAEPLLARNAISREEFDKLAGDRDEARAAVGVADSGVQLAKLNLKFTEVRAPFSGRISRRLIDPGSLVKADETILTSLVALEPVYVYFDVDERTLLRQLISTGRLDSAMQEKTAIQIGLADEEGFPHDGIVNFVDNRVDPNTGTMWMRGEFVSPKRPIKPGIFARIRFPLGGAYDAVVVAEQALGTDQGQKFLYVVDNDNRVSYRPVKIGRLHEGLRVIREGLQPGERVVVSGLQRVRAGGTVTPKAVDMLSAVVRPKPQDDTPDGPPAHAASPRSTEPGRASSGSPRTESGR